MVVGPHGVGFRSVVLLWTGRKEGRKEGRKKEKA
jgi:hypothetical protein